MRRKIPSSTSLQAFDAAARHGSFARAAEELSLTEGAISRQIARLESLLNCRLFDRTGSRVKLNPAGARYARHVHETLARLERDTQYIMGLPEGNKSLDIAVLPTFSSRWLIPRLGSFRSLHPDITLNIAASTDPFILSGSGFDAVIHFEHPAWTGMRMQFLFQEKLVPVCHPALLVQGDVEEQLNALPRIHRRQNPDAWHLYARESHINLDNPGLGVRYDLHEMAIAAVMAGQGVALVPRMYIENELRRGLLVSPWPESANLSKIFSLIKPTETGMNEAALADFERWLLAEITPVAGALQQEA
ncbi:UNVERIFIED_ORG: DNA-binding transcriptional LysR family regulator [Kosakonia oryzae]|uniref:DNA-binding transcriptional regulator, LysR family n=1 Tax=Kosakonia radicincitans TaxID=283686 RepID=A0AAX2ES55_9ENTR|nr:LysR substrate-binding domain-containing protein [Kosakonia radicincitans]MDP9566525.1 DNA-binding transcriptional LysR family regulator [Kosakonia oryzae]SFE52743.1 DNA-binding transcriptional regulator, LysR family [Kosakonia radicincitans]SFR13414.1 DNA-binding transcriptional regulator, LysR family [Kosakonia radicincitans]SFU10671.1 DNA-binding transcriptional regulator, LysR family [Kosakonia radicincitans]SFY18473.1 DNA-binding transcriptional regulator, LysR family [Kosakonia radici